MFSWVHSDENEMQSIELQLSQKEGKSQHLGSISKNDGISDKYLRSNLTSKIWTLCVSINAYLELLGLSEFLGFVIKAKHLT